MMARGSWIRPSVPGYCRRMPHRSSRFEVRAVRVAHVKRDAQGLGPGPYDLDRLGVGIGCDQESASATACDRPTHPHGLGGGGGFVEQGGIGKGKPGEVRDQGLEDQQRFESALGNLGLVGGVLGIPAGVLEDPPLDHSRHDHSRVPHAQPGARRLVLHRHGLQLVEEFGFAEGAVGQAFQRERFLAANRGRNGCVGEGIEGVEAQGLQHFEQVRATRADMTWCEGVRGVEYCGHGGSRNRARALAPRGSMNGFE